MYIDELNSKILVLQNSNEELKNLIDSYQKKLLDKENDLSNIKYEFEAVRFHNKQLCKRVELLQNDIKNKDDTNIKSNFLVSKDDFMIDTLNRELQDRILFIKSLEEKIISLERHITDFSINIPKVCQDISKSQNLESLNYYHKVFLTYILNSLNINEKQYEVFKILNMINKKEIEYFVQDPHHLILSDIFPFIKNLNNYANVFNIFELDKEKFGDLDIKTKLIKQIYYCETLLLEKINILTLSDLNASSWDEIQYKDMYIKIHSWLLTEQFIQGPANEIPKQALFVDETLIKNNATLITLMICLLGKVKSDIHSTLNDKNCGDYDNIKDLQAQDNFWPSIYKRINDRYASICDQIFQDLAQKASANDVELKKLSDIKIQEFQRKLTDYYDGELENTHRQVESGQSHIHFLEDEMKALEIRFNTVIKEKELLQCKYNSTLKDNSTIQGDLASMKANYEDQLTAMTDHVCQLHDKLQSFQRNR